MSESVGRCETCRWWWHANEVEERAGECHARAPLPVLANTDRHDWYDTEAWWPVTYDVDGCGEWRAKDVPPAASAYDSTPRSYWWWKQNAGIPGGPQTVSRVCKAMRRRLCPGKTVAEAAWSVADVIAVPLGEWEQQKNFGPTCWSALADWMSAPPPAGSGG